jgi:hypothetical protein
MSLDPTARESNVRDSVKKYFVDNLFTAEGVQLTFDRTLTSPDIIGGDAVDKWVSVNFGYLDADSFSSMMLTIYCCTRSDSEGFKLAQLRDRVMGHLTDTSQTDGMRRITFYRSKESGAWDVLGALLVQLDPESEQFEADDGTKYKMLSARLRWSSKI